MFVGAKKKFPSRRFSLEILTSEKFDRKSEQMEENTQPDKSAEKPLKSSLGKRRIHLRFENVLGNVNRNDRQKNGGRKSSKIGK